MTSFAFIFGVLPLALATGAGREQPNGDRHRRDRRHADRDHRSRSSTFRSSSCWFAAASATASRRSRERHSPAAGRRRHEARRRLDRAAGHGLHDDGAEICPARSGDPGVMAGRRSRISRRRRSACPSSPTSRSSRTRGCRALIAQALANNRDLMVAASNIAAAREQYRIQRAQQLPTLNASGGRDGQRRQGQRRQRELQCGRCRCRTSSSTCSAAYAR